MTEKLRLISMCCGSAAVVLEATERPPGLQTRGTWAALHFNSLLPALPCRTGESALWCLCPLLLLATHLKAKLIHSCCNGQA